MGVLRTEAQSNLIEGILRDAAQAKGRERYEGFVDALGRRLAKGNTLTKEVPEEVGNHRAR